MSGSHVDAPPDSQPETAPETAEPSGRGRLGWRIGTPVVVLLSGSLFAISAANSDGTDLRPGRYTDLASLVQSEADSYTALQQRATDLRSEVDGLTANVDDKQVRKRQRQAARLQGPAGLEEVSGGGLSIVLSDAPVEKLEEVLAGDDADQYRRFVVHQQDIQAVVNALWQGGAQAITIQGQRIVSTTGIRCSGSAVQLQGVPYPQPYRIQAVGDPGALVAAMQGDSDVLAFQSDAADPEIGLGFQVDVEDRVDAPAYAGLLDISYAEPVGQTR